MINQNSNPKPKSSLFSPEEILDSNTSAPEEEMFVNSLRAQSWGDFQGQEQIKKSLNIAIAAAKSRNEALDHILFYGPPGLGKTTLSHLISKELGVNLKISSGTALNKPGDLAAILTNLQPGDILFIDEIHRLPKIVEETLYPAMEDYALDIVLGKGPSARTIRLDLPNFTLIGATTRFGLLAGPFRDRFGLIHRLNYYDHQFLSKIVSNAADTLAVTIDPVAALEISQRSRGTPRIAIKLLKRVRDYVQVDSRQHITGHDVENALAMLAIDHQGLSEGDRRFLEQIIIKHNGGPVGLSTIAALLNEDSLTIEEVVEPYLIQIGFLKRTAKGREITPQAYAHLDLPVKK